MLTVRFFIFTFFSFISIQSVTSAMAFFYSTALQLQWQLLIFGISSTLGFAGFIFSEAKSRQQMTIVTTQSVTV